MQTKEVTTTQRVLNVWAIVLILWSLYRAKFRTDLPIWFDEFIAKPVIFILPVYYFIQSVEKTNFFSSIRLHTKKIWQEIAIGLGLGLIFFITGFLGHFINTQSFIPSSITTIITNLPLILVVALATSITEEIVSRGFVLERLYQESKNMYTSSFLASILFFILHIPILFASSGMNGMTLLYVMITDILFSLTVSIVYLSRRSLVSPIVIHFMYILSIYLLQGFS